MKLFRTGSMDVVQECRSYFGTELPSCLINKDETSFCHGLTVWAVCFVDIVASYDFFSLSITLYCLPLMLV